MSNFQDVITMATAIQTNYPLDIENDMAVLPKDAYYANLPKGITPEQAILVNEYNIAYTAASGYAAGQQAQAYFNDNPDAESFTMVCPLDHAEVNHKIYRNYEINGQEHPMYLASGYQVNSRNLEEDLIGLVINQVAELTLDATAELAA